MQAVETRLGVNPGWKQQGTAWFGPRKILLISQPTSCPLAANRLTRVRSRHSMLKGNAIVISSFDDRARERSELQRESGRAYFCDH